MTEKYNFVGNEPNSSWINHLILHSDTDKFCHKEGFNPKELSISLTINGEEVLVGDFNKVLHEWSDRIETALKHDLKYMKQEEEVAKRSRKIVEDKIGDIMGTLEDVEQRLWRLEP